MHERDNNKWDEQPRLLTDKEIADPIRVVHEVFDYAHLPDLRNTLWEWLKTTVSGNFNKPSLHYKDRESLMASYEKIQRLRKHLTCCCWLTVYKRPNKLPNGHCTFPPWISEAIGYFDNRTIDSYR